MVDEDCTGEIESVVTASERTQLHGSAWKMDGIWMKHKWKRIDWRNWRFCSCAMLDFFLWKAILTFRLLASVRHPCGIFVCAALARREPRTCGWMRCINARINDKNIRVMDQNQRNCSKWFRRVMMCLLRSNFWILITLNIELGGLPLETREMVLSNEWCLRCWKPNDLNHPHKGLSEDYGLQMTVSMGIMNIIHWDWRFIYIYIHMITYAYTYTYTYIPRHRHGGFIRPFDGSIPTQPHLSRPSMVLVSHEMVWSGQPSRPGRRRWCAGPCQQRSTLALRFVASGHQTWQHGWKMDRTRWFSDETSDL